MPDPQPSLTLASLVREMARAWQKLSLYQAGHPSRVRVVGELRTILAALLAPAGELALGVGRGAFLGPDERIEGGPVQPMANALYERGVALIRFAEGVDDRDLETLLTLLPRWRAAGDEEPLWERLAAAGVSRIRLEPVELSRVLAADGTEQAVPDSDRRDVFEAILQRLVHDGRFGIGGAREAAGDRRGGGESASLADILAVVRSLLERAQGDTGVGAEEPGVESAGRMDEVLAGLGQLLGQAAGGAVGSAADREALAVGVRQVAELLSALPAELREGVLEAALRGAAGEREGPDAFAALTGVLPAAEVVSALRRLRGEGIVFAPRVLGLVEDLVLRAAARPSPAVGVGPIDEPLRALLADDVEPPPARAAMDRLALELRRLPPQTAAHEELEPRLATLADEQVVRQLSQTLLELIQRPIFDEERGRDLADRVEQVVQGLLAEGHFDFALRLAQGLVAVARDQDRPESVRRAAAAALERLSRPGSMSALIEAVASRPGEGEELVRQLVDLLGEGVVSELLLAFCEEPDLRRRRQTFDLLVSLGSAAAPAAVALLCDERWYVVRNMLSLLRHARRTVPAEALARCVEHHDARVRLEAVKGLGLVPGGPPAEMVRRAVEDPDPKVAEGAIRAVGAHRLAAGSAALVELLQRTDPLGRLTGVRMRALAALGELGRPEVLPEIAHFFRTWFASVSADERRAAYAALAGYPAAARRPFLARGLKSPDREVREICRRLAAEAEG